MAKMRPRQHDRERVLRDVKFRILPAGYLWRGNTIDLSPDGAKLFSLQALQVGDLVELSWPDSNPQVMVTGRVVHIHSETEGTWSGIQFTGPINPQVFREMVMKPRRKAIGY